MTDVVNVEQINAVYLKVTADPGTRQEIQQFFSFRPNNYQFTPAYKNRVWDAHQLILVSCSCELTQL